MKRNYFYILVVIILTLNLITVDGESTEQIDKNINTLLKEDYKIIDVLQSQIVLLKNKDIIICRTRVQHKNSGKSEHDFINHSYEMKSRALRTLYNSQIKNSINSENFNHDELFNLLDEIDELNKKMNEIMINAIKTETTMITSCYKP